MNATVLILCVISGLGALGIYFGYLNGTGKMFQKTPESISAQSTRTKNQQHQAAQDAHARQRQLMDDMRQKIRDNSR